jgi:hypothetical protein
MNLTTWGSGMTSHVRALTRHALRLLLAVALVTLLAGCKSSSTGPDTAGSRRSFAMGFAGTPPRYDVTIAVAAIDLWSKRADAAMIAQSPPWDSLLAGVKPELLVTRDLLPLANYYRTKGHTLWLYLDPANGLNRTAEADELVKAHRSITEPTIQQLFRRFAIVADSILKPAHIGLALETNLIRSASPATLYAAVKQVANDAAADLRGKGTTAKLSVSVQVDHAWGNAAGPYAGIATDFTDFPYIDELGLSSYPYLAGFTAPEQLPSDYYSRLVAGKTIPVMVTEGGWNSETAGTVTSSPQIQRRYIVRQAALLDAAHATAVFQLMFTDLDIPALNLPPGSVLPFFAYNGLVDVNLTPKPALAVWDSLFAIAR